MMRRRLLTTSAGSASSPRRGGARAAMAAGAAAAVVAGILVASGPAEAAHVDRALHVGHPLAPGDQVAAAHGSGRLVVTRHGAVELVRPHSRVELAAAADSAPLARSTRLVLHADGRLAVRRAGQGTIATFPLTDHRVTRLTLSDSGRLTLWKGARKVATTALPAAQTAPTPIATVSAAPSTPDVSTSTLPADPTPTATPTPTTTPDPTPTATPAPTPTPTTLDIPVAVAAPVATTTDVPVVTADQPTATATATAAPVAADPAPAQASGVTGYALTTQYIGGGTAVNIRSAASLSASIVAAPAPGTAITIVCQTTGDPLGSGTYAQNRTWDRLGGAYTNDYVHDVLTTTPGGSRVTLSGGGYSAFSSNIPQCSDQGASPAPAAAAPVAAPVGNTGSYPAADAQDCSAQFGKYSWCINGKWASDRGFAYRNCTDYVGWRLNLKWSDVSSNGSGNAIDWRQGWINRGRTVSTTPKVGAVAWWGTTKSSYGHVGVVIAVNGDGSARIAQYNGAGDGRYSETSERAVAYLY